MYVYVYECVGLKNTTLIASFDVCSKVCDNINLLGFICSELHRFIGNCAPCTSVSGR